VERELIVFHDPTLPMRAVEGFRPVPRSYDLVRSLLRGDAGDRPTYVQNFRVGAVAPNRFAVDPAYIGGPAIVVCVGQTARLTLAVGSKLPPCISIQRGYMLCCLPCPPRRGTTLSPEPNA